MALGLSALVAACSDSSTQPEPPKKPPQLATSAVYTNTVVSCKCPDNGKQNGLPSNDVRAMLAVSNGEFWIGTIAGLVRYPNLTTTERPPDNYVNEVNGLPNPQVTDMVELSGKVYVSTWGGGLGVYDIGGHAWPQFRPGATGLTDGNISQLAVSTTENKVYLSSNDGVFIYTPGANTWQHESTVRDISENDPNFFTVERLQSTISSVVVTEAAGVVQRWYGPRVEMNVDAGYEKYYGILVSKNTAAEYKYSTVNSGLVERNVNDIFYDPVRNTYWVAYVTQGISEVNVDASTWTDYTLVQGLPSNTVYSITRASDGNGGTTLWAATQAGLAKLNSLATEWQGYGRSAGLPADRVRVVYSDDGNRLWAGFIDGGAAKIKP